MPNGRVHGRVGAATGAAAAWLASTSEPDYARALAVVGGGFGGWAGGRLPDHLEPAVHPNHRDLCHSLGTSGALAWGAAKTFKGVRDDMFAHAARLRDCRRSLPPDDSRRFWLGLEEGLTYLLFGALVGAPVGYLGHVAMDFATPKCVPLICRDLG